MPSFQQHFADEDFIGAEVAKITRFAADTGSRDLDVGGTIADDDAGVLMKALVAAASFEAGFLLSSTDGLYGVFSVSGTDWWVGFHIGKTPASGTSKTVRSVRFILTMAGIDVNIWLGILLESSVLRCWGRGSNAVYECPDPVGGEGFGINGCRNVVDKPLSAGDSHSLDGGYGGMLLTPATVTSRIGVMATIYGFDPLFQLGRPGSGVECLHPHDGVKATPTTVTSSDLANQLPLVAGNVQRYPDLVGIDNGAQTVLADWESSMSIQLVVQGPDLKNGVIAAPSGGLWVGYHTRDRTPELGKSRLDGVAVIGNCWV